MPLPLRRYQSHGVTMDLPSAVTHQMQHDFPLMRTVAMLEEINSLPGA
jgi:hypothetical protein